MSLHVPPIRQNSPHLPFGDHQDLPFYGKDILSVKQFSREDLAYIFEVAHEMQEMVRRVGSFDLLKGKILANLFYEPSTRTSSSFTSAMERLGGSVIPISEVKYSSVSKGESLPDTIRTLECYADVIVLRHPETGSAAIAAKAARKPSVPTMRWWRPPKSAASKSGCVSWNGCSAARRWKSSCLRKRSTWRGQKNRCCCRARRCPETPREEDRRDAGRGAL